MESAELAVIEKTNAMEIFTQKNGLDPFLARIRQEVHQFKPDVSTPTSRKDIASMAHKVARSKTYIDGIGKHLVADLKELPRKIDTERKRVRDILEGLKNEVRKPLTLWEQKEQERVAAHKHKLDALVGIRERCLEAMTSNMVLELKPHLKIAFFDHDFEEFQTQATNLYNEIGEMIQEKGPLLEKQEAEQAELLKLRQEKLDREAKDHEEKLKKEAAENARAEEKQRADREIKREKLRVEQMRLQAERVQREKEQAAVKFEQDKIDAAERADMRQKEALAHQQERIAEEERIKAEQVKIRKADLDHRTAVIQEILGNMKNHGIDDMTAQKIVSLVNDRQLGKLVIEF